MRAAKSRAEMRHEITEIDVTRGEHVKLLQTRHSLGLDLTVVVRLHDSASSLWKFKTTHVERRELLQDD